MSRCTRPANGDLKRMNGTAAAKRVRCAIYTRKSSAEALDQQAADHAEGGG